MLELGEGVDWLEVEAGDRHVGGDDLRAYVMRGRRWGGKYGVKATVLYVSGDLDVRILTHKPI